MHTNNDLDQHVVSFVQQAASNNQIPTNNSDLAQQNTLAQQALSEVNQDNGSQIILNERPSYK